jgi:HAD superfamily hydrolase (TIGR01509 family)
MIKKNILFDNDGVLVDTEQWYYKANVEILKDMGVALNEARYMDIMIHGRSAFEVAEEVGFPHAEIEAARDRRNVLYQHYIKTEDITISGVHEIIKELSKKYTMCVITSALREDFELIHKNSGITECMEFALCSGEYGRAKPYPDPYLKGLERLGAHADESIVVEDSQRGLHSALNAGMECVVVHNHFTVSHDLSKATHKIQTLAELEALL